MANTLPPCAWVLWPPAARPLPYSTQPHFPIITPPPLTPRCDLACQRTTPVPPRCNLRNGLPIPKLDLSLHRQVQGFRGLGVQFLRLNEATAWGSGPLGR